MDLKNRNIKLPPEVNRILFVRNLPNKITGEELYDIFGKYGAIRQIRKGNKQNTSGTAYVVYEDIYDAKMARDKLSGVNISGRYLNIYYFSNKNSGFDFEAKKKEIQLLKQQYGIE